MSDPREDDVPQDAATDGQEGAAPEGARDLEAEVAHLKDQLLRAMAEVENVRRRAQKEREDTAKYAISNFAKELVGVADNLRRALDSVPEAARETNEAVKNLLIGVEATERQLTAAFGKAGIQRLEPMGKPFDPNFHQVVVELENTGQPAGTVVQELQSGFTIQGRLLREAMVAVAKGDPAPTKTDA